MIYDTTQTAANALVRGGFSIVPVKIDGSKEPSVKWTRYQSEKPSVDQVRTWFRNGVTRGIAAIQGRVSGNAETVDFDDPELFDPFIEQLEILVQGLAARLVQTWTPRPGYQITYRCPVIGRNRGLAFGERPARPNDNPKSVYENDDGEFVVRYATIETRAEGGYIVAVGSPARVHKNNKPYEFINGDYEHVPEITPEERDIIFSICEGLSQLPILAESESEDRVRMRRERKPGELLPGDDYNERGDNKALIEKHGWQYKKDDRFGELWTRPGKDVADGHSARLWPNGNLQIFTSNGGRFKQGECYSPFARFAELEHGGDFKAAAKALAKAGYGDPLHKAKTGGKSADKSAQAGSAEGKAAKDGANDKEETADTSIPDLELLEGNLRLRFKRLPRSNVSIEVESEEKFVYQDQLYLSRAAHRSRFLKKVAKLACLTEEQQAELEEALLLKSREVETFIQEERQEPAQKPVGPAGEYIPYEARDGKLIWWKPIIGSRELDGIAQPVTLTNFAATITGDVVRNDGTEPVQVFEVEVNIIGNGGPHKGTVKAVEFSAMRWPVAVAGARAVIYAGKIEHARAAVQLLSDNIKVRRVVAHTGWRKEADKWRFYHAGGAIGAEGPILADVELPPALAPCVLPAPPTGERLHEVVRTVTFELSKVAPDWIILPLIGCVFVAVLTGGDFSLFLLGTTGKGKTELLILAQSFFGAGFSEKHIPSNWGSTAYSIQGITHLAKDIVCGVDDFVPKGTQIEQAKLHGKAEVVLRGQANSSGRARCNPDGSVRPERPPRGLIVATGEDLPRGQSLVARLLATEVKEGNVDWAQLTLCQKRRREGVFAEATSAFLQWLATDNRIEKLQKEAADKIHELRTGWAKTGADIHKKVANTLAQLQRAWDVWLDFAVECGAIDSSQRETTRAEVKAALNTAGSEQARFLANENPATRFVELLTAAIRSGRAHVAAAEDDLTPADPAAWGWEERILQVHGKPVSEWAPKGDRIGWIRGDEFYLQPDAAYKMAQAMGVNGEGLTISSQTLWKRMKEEGLLATVDEKSQTNKVRKAISTRTERVIHIRAISFFPADDPG